MHMRNLKPFIVLTCITGLVLLQQCANQKSPAIDYPPDMVADSQRVFAQHFEKGEILYRLNCAKCHDTLVDGRKVVPDFSLPQLLDYEMRFQYASHENRLREVDVSIAELDDIQHYLRYKKRSGILVSPLPMKQPPPKMN